MQKITRRHLDDVVNYLNRITNNPDESYTNKDGKLIGNVGNFHISSAYGGVSLHQTMNESGGIRDVLGCGHVPNRELYNLIHAYRNGIEYMRSEVTA